MSDNNPTSVDLKEELLSYLHRAVTNGVKDEEGAVSEIPASLVSAAINFLKQFPPDPEEERLKAAQTSELLEGVHPTVQRKFEPKVISK